ncbi:titin-like [Megalops cyprinoides]|uniref:titin-like n=1 Tax=Megalops cyprinoides TaxID=118141 RepID=UPI0018644396|nr:titin-like [Megalops cyprinoides]
MVSLQAACALYNVLTLFTTFTEAMKSIRAASGSSVHLPCPLPYNDADIVAANWTKDGSSNTLCIYRMEGRARPNIVSCKSRVNLTGHPPELYLTKLKISDAGIYTCKMSRIVPPPTEETIFKMRLYVEGSPVVSIKQVESNQSGCQWLLCQLEWLNPAEVNFTWSREGQRIPSNRSAGSLHLCKSDWNEGETFTCTISFNNTHLSNSITLNGTNGGK